MAEQFDRSRLRLRDVAERKSLVYIRDAKDGIGGVPPYSSPELDEVASMLMERTGPRVWFFGGHMFKANVWWYINELLPYIDHMATNGAGLLHDWEVTQLGCTSEDVASGIKDGTYGMWDIQQINNVVSYTQHFGLGSVFFPEYNSATVHVAVGQDVFCMMPNYDPCAWGRAAYVDFLKFVSVVEAMQGGTLLVFGSAVCAPEVFLKALAMARNANSGKPDDVAVAVFDCVLPPPSPEDRYFHRPSKNLMGRCASESVFVHGRHEETIPNLWRLLCG